MAPVLRYVSSDFSHYTPLLTITEIYYYLIIIISLWIVSDISVFSSVPQHPYPSEEQKKQLAQDTGLTILQVNNWWVFFCKVFFFFFKSELTCSLHSWGSDSLMTGIRRLESSSNFTALTSHTFSTSANESSSSGSIHLKRHGLQWFSRAALWLRSYTSLRVN